MNLNMTTELGVTHNITTFFADGGMCKKYKPMKNMITRNGMNDFGVNGSAELTLYMHIGTGTTSTNRSITGSQSGNILTVTDGEFTEADVTNNRWISLSGGGGMYIVSLIDSSNVVVDTSINISSQPMKVYNVEQSALTTEVYSGNLYDAGSDKNYSTNATRSDALVCTHVRTGKSGVLSGGVDITEIGLSVGGGSLFSRLTPDEPIHVPDGGFLTNTHILQIEVDNSVKTLDSPISGITGNATCKVPQTEEVLNHQSVVSANGTTYTGYEPYWMWVLDNSTTPAQYIGISDSDSALDTLSYLTSVNNSTIATYTSYVADSFESVITAVFSGAGYTSEVWRDIYIRNAANSYSVRVLWDEPQVFDGTHALTVKFTKTWRRG